MIRSSLALATAVLLAGCDTGPTQITRSSSAPAEEPPFVVPPEPETSPVRADQILAPRDAASLEAYAGVDVTLRLFGVEDGDGTRPATAVFADTSTWVTRPYEAGALLGRGAVIEDVRDDRVRIRTAQGVLLVRSGEDVRLRWIRHVDDRVVRPLGRHRYVFYPRAARATPQDVALERLEVVELHGRQVARLPTLADGTRLAAAGFREGDLLAEVDGKVVGADAHAVLDHALATDAPFQVKLIRSGVPIVLRFVPSS